MTKAVFIDYTGTMVREDDPYSMQLVKIFVTNSDIKDPQEAFVKVWGVIKQIETEYYMDSFVKKHGMVDLVLDYSEKHFGLSYDRDEIHSIWEKSWVHAPLYDDVLPFFERTKAPIYVVTNDDIVHIQESMKEKGIKPAGIISAEMVRACKPHREILDEGIRVANVDPACAVMIGDSETSDVACALEVGVVPILLDRKGKSSRTDIRVIKSLSELDF